MPKSDQTSWVFANVKGGITRAISQLRKINNVESVIPVTGRFDLVIKLRTNEPNKTFNIVEKIRKIKGIASTQTGISLQKISNAKKERIRRSYRLRTGEGEGRFQERSRKDQDLPELCRSPRDSWRVQRIRCLPR